MERRGHLTPRSIDFIVAALFLFYFFSLIHGIANAPSGLEK